ncbi:MAG: MBL fold metallo-hydrolase [Chloroflexi bacterium]|nr:MBL fold metallo-hydrolase [Chloroflexota bacterium]MBM3154454.1 MBL fold metallo-hydrolase [Chloroflexota bacterium]MBM3165884.1 MBL fold metallo-hydrolase [Chloroflexota bacterium]MBM3173261.1 MBL fold metallo-hydrolase [Chloroflexota bacterium]MBM4449254.1 MBL fold metallo-hydrolase [Chloroflexota bacterium]
MIIRFLGTHNQASQDKRLISLLIDYILVVDAGNIVADLSFDEQRRIRAILLSHGHYDHIRDIPAYAFNNTVRTTSVYATPYTLEFLSSHLADGLIYPKFTEKYGYVDRQVLQFCPLEHYISQDIEGYRVTAVPVNHPLQAVGFEITSPKGKKVFYTGDTGPGLAAAWQHVSPDYLIIEVTLPNRLSEQAKASSHLCPDTLKQELLEFRKTKGYLPPTCLVHMSPEYEKEIIKEAAAVSRELRIPIRAMAEGDKLSI